MPVRKGTDRSQILLPLSPDGRERKQRDSRKRDDGLRELRELRSTLIEIIDGVDYCDMPDIDVQRVSPEALQKA